MLEELDDGEPMCEDGQKRSEIDHVTNASSNIENKIAIDRLYQSKKPQSIKTDQV